MVHKSSLRCAILTTSENEAPRNFYQVIICDANSRDVAFAKMQPADYLPGLCIRAVPSGYYLGSHSSQNGRQY